MAELIEAVREQGLLSGRCYRLHVASAFAAQHSRADIAQKSQGWHAFQGISQVWNDDCSAYQLSATGNAPVTIKMGGKTDGLWNRLATRSSCIGSAYLVRRYSPTVS
jgi:hypothetical protein